MAAFLAELKAKNKPTASLDDEKKEDPISDVKEEVANMTAEDSRRIQGAFSLFDKDGSGSIETEEMLELMVLLDPKMTREEFKKLIAEYDKDGDGEISWEEFCVLMKPAIVGHDLEEHDARMTEEDMRAAFGIADADDSGYIEKEELGALLASLGEGLNADDLDALFAEMDEDKSGGIDFDEFKALMMVLNDDGDPEEEER